MSILTTAKLNWFDNGCCDVRFLDIWQSVPLNLSMNEVGESHWHHDHHEMVLGHDLNGQLFQKAAYHLLRYHFYPHTVMKATSDFGLNGRCARVGDRIVQRIHLVRLFGRPIVDVMTMTEVTQVINTPRHAMLAYATVANHITQGQWCASVEWRDDGMVLLTMSAVSRPAPQEPKRNAAYFRAFQKQANLYGIAYLTELVKTAVVQPA